jgi:hypothetical protein
MEQVDSEHTPEFDTTGVQLRLKTEDLSRIRSGSTVTGPYIQPSYNMQSMVHPEHALTVAHDVVLIAAFIR